MSTTAEQEIRNEFAEWFRNAAARDVDVLMTKIADSAHSFEHQVPLEYAGADAIRESCEQGFDAERASSAGTSPSMTEPRIPRGVVDRTGELSHAQ
jgi:ketosteroid isomerase-like protein